MIYMTSLLTGSVRCVEMLRETPPPHCLSQVKTSCHFLQTDVTMREQTFVQQASGDGSNACAFFDIRVFHPNAQSYRHSSISSLYRHHEQWRENMETELERLRTVPSLHLSLPQQEAWVGRLHYLTRIKYLKRGTPYTAKPWHGLGAPSPSPSYDPQWCAFEAAAQHLTEYQMPALNWVLQRAGSLARPQSLHSELYNVYF